MEKQPDTLIADIAAGPITLLILAGIWSKRTVILNGLGQVAGLALAGWHVSLFVSGATSQGSVPFCDDA